MHSFRLDIQPSQQTVLLVAVVLVLLILSCAILFISIWSVWACLTLMFSLLMAGCALINIKKNLYQPAVMVFSDNQCVIDEQSFEVAYHSFYLGDWFWLKLMAKNPAAQTQVRYMVISPDMIEQPEKCHLKRCLKRINSAFGKAES